MAKSRESFNKKEREKKRLKKNEDKELKKADRRAGTQGGKDLEEMLAFVDENGNLTSTPPDPSRKRQVDAASIQISTPRKGEEPEAAPRQGIVTFFNTDKGYGFIRDQDTQESLFFHITDTVEPLREQDRVTYDVRNSPRGLNAVQVRKTAS
jgi:cold shock CspA family protein